MEAMEAILSRGSCRKFKDTPVEPEYLTQIADAGGAAAVGKGSNSPTFVIITRKELLAKLSKINAEIMGVDFDPFYGAPAAILVLADRNKPTAVQDGSSSMQNMQLAAHALGLGSCWIHRAYETFEREDGRALLVQMGITDDLMGIAYCVIGHPAVEICAKAHPHRIVTIA